LNLIPSQLIIYKEFGPDVQCITLSELKCSTLVLKAENPPAIWSLTCVGQKGNLSYDMEMMWKLT
jgi:hypothetical protein